jgi:hypothetical protein
LGYWGARIRADSLDRFHNVHALDYLSKHHVLAVELQSDLRSDEELSTRAHASSLPKSRAACISEAVLARRELAGILRREWHQVIEQAKHDFARCLRVNGDVGLHIQNNPRRRMWMWYG